MTSAANRALLSAWLVLAACTSEGPGGPECTSPEGLASSALIYDEDDRREPFELSGSPLETLARQSIVALVSPRALAMSDPSRVVISAEPLGEKRNLCPGQRFADQPGAATCSGTLVDDDLVLTAGHCIKSEAQCRSTRFVFGYAYEAPGTLAPLTAADVFSCRRVVTRRLETAGERTDDFAIVQLDRPATPRFRPAATQRGHAQLTRGAELTMLGFPDGLPLKVEDAGLVLSTRDRTGDYFRAAVDAFEGNSGSGVFDRSRTLIGILVRGGTDYVEQCGCRVPNRRAADGSNGEAINYIGTAITALCDDAGWPSGRLCDRPARCGDGTCSGAETFSTCPAECPAPSCGNGICEGGEAGSCDADCGAPPAPPPASDLWSCPAEYFGTRDGCDCECGAYDPDCDDPSQMVLNCEGTATCDPSGHCALAATEGVPAAWICPASYYGTRDGCDCDCGALDPDCSDPAQELFNCASGQTCGGDGLCTGGGTSAPAGWACDPSWFGVSDGCDCGCGTRDPDCDDPMEVVLGCSAGQICDASGSCAYGGSWTCEPSYFGTGDGCDCNCGAYDPDCADPWQTVYGCTTGQTCGSDGRCTGGAACAPSPISPWPGTACLSSTLGCLSGCADAACQQACIAADPNPDCGACISQNQIACANSQGCQSSWDCAAACLETNCSADWSCWTTTCASETSAFEACQTSVAGACGTAYLSCFP